MPCTAACKSSLPVWGLTHVLSFLDKAIFTSRSWLTFLQRKEAKRGKLFEEKSNFPVLLAATAAAALVGLLVLRRYATGEGSG
jgi:hypothetical protein